MFAASFHLKLLTRATAARDSLIKRRVLAALATFNPHVHDPLDLTRKLYDACAVELVDLYKEFLCFLTPEQADRCDAFKDYFVRNCVRDLVKRIEVSDDRIYAVDETVKCILRYMHCILLGRNIKYETPKRCSAQVAVYILQQLADGVSDLYRGAEHSARLPSAS